MTEAAGGKPNTKKHVRDALLAGGGIILSAAAMLWAATTNVDRGYMYASILIMLFVLVPFYVSFEKDRPYARQIVLIAVMVTIAVAGRAAFFWIPQFKPIIAVVIIAGVAMGAQAGFVVGSMSAFVSNFIFGQGPWTPFQMVAWGLIGMVAGLLFYRKMGPGAKAPAGPDADRQIGKGGLAALLIYGAVSCFIFHGAITDLWTALSLTDHPTLGVILTVYGTGLIADAVLAAATVIFLLLMARPMLKKLDRVMMKYGMLE